MLKSIEKLFYSVLDVVLPERVNFTIVKKLDEKTITSLPKAPSVDGMDWIYPIFHYKNSQVRAIVWELKYRENILPLEHIGKMIYEEILLLASDILIFNASAEFLLIPIPISEMRRAERGYNQGELIAKSVLINDSSKFLDYKPEWFSKIKDTPRQSHSESRLERISNLKGCFKADSKVRGKYIILLDDVVTTGSTLKEARETLLSAGARDVFAFTIAH